MDLELEPTTTPSMQTESNFGGPANFDYSSWLDSLGIRFKRVQYHLQIGELNQSQGWILHLSAVYSQVTELLQLVVPILVQEQETFKIVDSLQTVDDLMAGNLGVKQIGKIVTIYPTDASAAVTLATHLLNLTKTFKGPYIPTDVRLGNIVYTRYGSFSPITHQNEKGEEEGYFYGADGKLQLDHKPIPFEFPQTSNGLSTKSPNPSFLIRRPYSINYIGSSTFSSPTLAATSLKAYT